MAIKLKVREPESVKLKVGESDSVSLSVGAEIVQRVADPYTGSYEYTPSADTQTIPILGKTATADIVINPIPNNYGLIGYNGSILTVS